MPLPAAPPHSTVFGQRDPRWADKQLGTLPGSKIGPWGCYLCTFTGMAVAFGHPTTPPELNTDLITRQAFVDGNLLAAGALQRVYADCKLLHVLYYVTGPADLAVLGQMLARGYRVALEVDIDHNPGNGIQTHFGEALATDGQDVLFADPWYGDIRPMSQRYGGLQNVPVVIQKFVVYEGPTTVVLDDDPAMTLEPPAGSLEDPELKAYFETYEPVNMATGLMQFAARAYRRNETPGPAINGGEYDAIAPDGRAVRRQDFTGRIAEYDPETGECFWVELVLHPEALRTNPPGI